MIDYFKHHFDSFIVGLFLTLLFFFPVKVDFYNVVASFYVLNLLVQKKISFLDLFLDKVFIFLGGWFLIALISRYVNDLGLNRITLDVLTVVYPYFLGRLLPAQNVYKYFKLFVLVLFWSTIISFVVHFSDPNYVVKAKLFFKNVSRTSLFLALGILICVFFTLSPKTKIKIRVCFTGLSLWFLALMYVMQELTPLASLFVCLVLLLANVIPLPKLKWLVVVGVLGLGVVVLTFSPKFNYLKQNPLQKVTVNHRYNMWKAALNMFEEKPLWGQGFRSFKQKYKSFLDKKDKFYSSNMLSSGYQDPHNLNLTLLSELGLVGWAWVTGLFGFIFYFGLWKYRKNQTVFLISLFIFFIYLNMQMHVHLGVHSVMAIWFWLIGLFFNKLSQVKINTSQ